jgi:hypothetical protein
MEKKPCINTVPSDPKCNVRSECKEGKLLLKWNDIWAGRWLLLPPVTVKTELPGKGDEQSQENTRQEVTRKLLILMTPSENDVTEAKMLVLYPECERKLFMEILS